jgi:hypothetical protein
MAEVDRSKRYANPPKKPKKTGSDGSLREHEGKAEAAADAAEKKEGAGKGPTDKNPGPVGKVGTDPGPEGGKDAEFGVVAERHKREHADMLKRHTEAVGGMQDAHAKEAKGMVERHHKELQDGMEQKGEAGAEKTAGSPQELGTEKKIDGNKGSEP